MNEGLQVIMVSAFYRDNEPGGIATGMQLEAPDRGVELCCLLEQALPEYDNLTLNEVLAELRRLAPRRSELTYEESIHVVMCIHWMQRRGHLKPDEYNGTMFASVLGGTILSTERNPVTMDLATEMAGDGAVDVTDVVKASLSPGVDRGLVASIRTMVDHARGRL